MREAMLPSAMAVPGHGGDHVLVQRLAVGAGLLGAVQHGDGFACDRQGREQVLRAKGRNSRTLIMPTFSPWRQEVDGLLGGTDAPEPMSMMTRSASGAPTYSNSL
jgi:hypothetical protein